MTKPQKIEFHVGHYGDGTGARGIVDEVQYARKFIRHIYEICVANSVPFTYYEDKVSKSQTQNINNLVAHHNQDCNGFIVSGHLNSSGMVTEQGIGVEVLYYDQLAVAKKVVDSICNASDLKTRGPKKRTDWGVLAATYEPAILIEFGFVNSRTDVRWLDKYFEAICQAVAKVLAEHIGYTIKQVEKDDDTMQFTNETTKAAVCDYIKQVVDKKLIDKMWLDKFDNGTMTNGDYAGLKRIIAQRSN